MVMGYHQIELEEEDKEKTAKPLSVQKLDIGHKKDSLLG
jgi:hypothetical protein